MKQKAVTPERAKELTTHSGPVRLFSHPPSGNTHGLQENMDSHTLQPSLFWRDSHVKNAAVPLFKAPSHFFYE